MIDSRDREIAQATLNRLLVGASVVGIRFGALQLILDPPEIAGESCINLSSAWLLYDKFPTSFPENESDIADSSFEAEIATAVSLQHKTVKSAELGDPWPHLIVTFSDGAVLYLNGKNEQYEPWIVAHYNFSPNESTQVIACPGGDVICIPSSGER